MADKEWSPGEDGGFRVEQGYYRVPDLLTEEGLIQYMWDTYKRKVVFLPEEDDEPQVEEVSDSDETEDPDLKELLSE